MVEDQLEVRLPNGVHLEPATKLIWLIRNSNSEVSLVFENQVIKIGKVTDILRLGLHQHKFVIFRADGPDEDEVIEKIKALIQNERIDGIN